MPSIVAKRPKIPGGVLGRGADLHCQIPHEGGREGSEETPQNFHPGRMGLASGKGSCQTDPGERSGLRNGGGTPEMAYTRHTRKRSLCISNLRIMEQKTCIRCKQTKPITEFGRLKSTEDGMNPRCKSCLREYARSSYSKRKSTLPARRGGVIHNPDLAGYTDRKLLEELKARGFVWSDMKRIQPVKYDSI